MSNLVAREKQLDQLKIVLKGAIKGRLQIVFVTGEAGSGKTALVETFVEQSERDIPGLLIAGSKCQAIAEGLQEPYLPFILILEHILEVALPEKKSKAVWNILQRGMSETGSDFLHLIPIVGGPFAAAKSIFEWSRSELGAQGQDPDIHSRLRQYVNVFRLTSETAPLLLWIDDLQWSDVATVDLISYLADYAKDARIMLIATYRPTDITHKVQGRPHPVKRLVNKLKRPPPQCVELPVPAFTLADIEEFLKVSQHRFPSTFVERLWRNSGGNILFVKEYVSLLHAHRILRRERGAYVLTQPDTEIEIPTNVQHVIEQRLGLIGRGLRKVLSYASVQGNRFASNILAQLLRSPELEILENLDTLEQDHNLVRELETQRLFAEVGAEYEFIHPIIQQFIYSEMGTGQRRRLHLEIAQLLENLYGERVGQHASDLVIHFERGGDLERAIYYYLRAGRQSLDSMTLDDALIQTEAAQRLVRELGEDEHAVDWQIESLIQFAEIYHKKAEYEAASDSLDRGLELAGSEPSVLLAKLLLIRCAVLTSLEELDGAMQVGQKAIQVAQEVDARPEEAYAYDNLGVAYGRQGNIESALECHQRSLAMRRELGLTREITQSLVNLSVVSGILSHQKRTEGRRDEADRLLDEAEGYLREALKKREQIDDKYGLGSVYHNLGLVDLERGQIEAAESKFLRALDLWKQVGYLKGIAFAHHDLGSGVYATQKRWDEARIHLEQSAQIYKSIGADARLLAENYKALADVYRNMDWFQEALTAAQEALGWASNSKQEQEAKELLHEIDQLLTSWVYSSGPGGITPEFARNVQHFFTLARFSLQLVDPEGLVLTPQGQDHLQVYYGPMYARLITERSPTGDDFTAVCKAARRHYGDDMAHRVALVISDRRPEPGARYRLYEIRQREGLAIVPLDVSLFGQIKPNRTANDILAAEIDQATGRQDLYAISGPVSGDLSFFGRERVLQEIIDLLDAGQPVGLFGLRKVGKTSLIQRLQGRLDQRRPIALVDTQTTARQQGVWPLYPAIIAGFAAHLERTRPDLALPDLRLYPEAGSLSPALAESFLQDLRALHAALGQPEARERLLLIVDEVDRLFPSGETPGYEGFAAFFGQLRAANQQARLLDFVVVGVNPGVNRRERWQDTDNELYRALREVWMPSMSPQDVQEMIESLGAQMGVRYEPEALHLLAQAGGGQPFVTRQICSLAVEGRLGRGVVTVTMDQAQAAIEEFVFRDPYLPELWRTRLDDTQREMLCILARAVEPIPRTRLLPPAQRQAALVALGALEERTLVRRDEGGYTIAWDVFRDWIRWVELGLEE